MCIFISSFHFILLECTVDNNKETHVLWFHHISKLSFCCQLFTVFGMRNWRETDLYSNALVIKLILVQDQLSTFFCVCSVWTCWFSGVYVNPLFCSVFCCCFFYKSGVFFFFFLNSRSSFLLLLSLWIIWDVHARRKGEKCCVKVEDNFFLTYFLLYSFLWERYCWPELALKSQCGCQAGDIVQQVTLCILCLIAKHPLLVSHLSW